MHTLGSKSISCTPRAVSQAFDGHGVFDNRGSCWEAATEAGRTFLSGGAAH
jgi:hypothetical protein